MDIFIQEPTILQGHHSSSSLLCFAWGEHWTTPTTRGSCDIWAIPNSVRLASNWLNEWTWFKSNPLTGEARQPTVLRSCIDIGCCSSNVLEFLGEMGFRLEFEYVLKGYLFRKGRMKVTMSKLFRLPVIKKKTFSVLISNLILMLNLSVLSSQHRWNRQRIWSRWLLHTWLNCRYWHPVVKMLWQMRSKFLPNNFDLLCI